MTEPKQVGLSHSSPTLARRSLLILAIAGLLAPFFAFLSPAKNRDAVDEFSAALLASFHSSSAASVGQVVLAAYPEFADVKSLIAQLLGDLGLNARSVEDAPASAIKARITSAVRQDFTSGRVVNVVGWRLALTEARLCALAAQRSEMIGRT